MSQAAHSEDWSPVAGNSGRGRRIRFEMARSQLLVLTAALALLAMLFFLSGLAIGLLIHPRWAPASPQVQNEVRSPVTAPRAPVRDPARSTDWVSAGDPPPEELDLADIVWQPRRSLEPWERASSEAPNPVEPASQPAATPSEAIPSEDIATPVRVAQANPVVDPTFEPRPVGLAQPPRRWRQAQPLAAAYLTAPEETSLPDTSDPGVVEPDADSVQDADPADFEPAQIPADLTQPSAASSPGTDSAEDDSRFDRAIPSQERRSAPQLVEDTGWRPSSSHWQTFFDDLSGDGSEGQSTSGEGADSLMADSGTIDFEPQNLAPVDPVPSETMGEVSVDAASPDADADALQAPDLGAQDGGWQPTSNLWQSFLDNPYDWTADRLPPEPTRRSTVPRGSMQVPYGDLMDRAARRHGLDVALVAAMVRVESDFDPQAVSHRGARGLMQVMPATAQRFGVAADDLFDPAVNLDVGMRYLAWLEDRFAGDTERMLAAYNAGEAAVDAYDGVPPYGETQRYVKRIYRLMGWAETQ